MMDNRHSYMVIIADSICMGQFDEFRTEYSKAYRKTRPDGAVYDYRCHVMVIAYYLWKLVHEEQGLEEEPPVPKPLEDLLKIKLDPWLDPEFQKSIYRIRNVFPAHVDYLKFIMSKHGAQYWYVTTDYQAALKYDGIP